MDFFSYIIHILKIRYQHVYNDYFAYFYCEGMIWKTLGHLHQAHNKWKSSNEFCTVIDLTLNFLTKNMRCFWVPSRDTNSKGNPHRLVTRTTMTTTGQQQIRNWKEACRSRLGKFKFQHFPISSFVSLFLELELNKDFVIAIYWSRQFDSLTHYLSMRATFIAKKKTLQKMTLLMHCSWLRWLSKMICFTF